MSELGPGLSLLGLRGAPLALASRSPRRRELLSRLDLPLVFIDVDVEEGCWDGNELPDRYVERLASEKADAALDLAREAGAYAVLAADTIVSLEGNVLEKPVDRADARRLIGQISGRSHTVFTGLDLVRIEDGRRVRCHERTRVFFDELSGPNLDVYLDTEEPMDKAGAYGIQGWGGIFVPKIEGDYFNVMGLPLAALRKLCLELEEHSR